jgi:hypothetical protein
MEGGDSSRKENLSAAQLAALEGLVGGKTVSEAAAAAGVHRNSVHNWLRDDLVFQARLNHERRQLQEQMAANMMRLAVKAATVVDHYLDNPRADLCIDLLKGLGLLTGKLPPVGSADADELGLARAKADQSREAETTAARDRALCRLAMTKTPLVREATP